MMRRLAFLLFFFFLAAPAEAEKILNVQTLKSPDGIEVWLVEDKSVPVVSMSFSFDGGLALEPESKPGTARLVSILLDEGAGSMKSQEFQSKLSDNAISLGFSAGRDAFTGQLRTLKKNQSLAFDLLKLALASPRFDEDAIRRMKNTNIAEIKSNMGDPSWLAARTFNGMIFAGHYYARPGYGTLAGTEAVTRKDLQDFARRQFTRAALKVSIAGDISAQEATDLLDKTFCGLPEKAAADDLPAADISAAGKTILLPLETPQTYISAGIKGISHKDPDWHAALVMNEILGGGGFDARLMKEIREKRGLTYGVYSSLSSMKRAAMLQATLSSSNDKTAEAIDLLKKEMAKMAAEGPTEKELADAKSYLTGSLLLQLTSTGDVADALNGLQQNGYASDYVNARNDALNAVTLDDVRRVSNKLLKPENMTVVLVGKPENVKPDITLDKPPGMQ